jgi:hypothetical protein
LVKAKTSSNGLLGCSVQIARRTGSLLPSLERGLSDHPIVTTPCKEAVGRGTASILATLAVALIVAAGAAGAPRVGFADDATKYSDDGGAQLFGKLRGVGAVENRVAVYWDPAQPETIQEQDFLDRMLPVAAKQILLIVFSV